MVDISTIKHKKIEFKKELIRLMNQFHSETSLTVDSIKIKEKPSGRGVRSWYTMKDVKITIGGI